MIIYKGESKLVNWSNSDYFQFQRWVVEVALHGISLHLQTRSSETEKWRSVDHYYSIWVTRYFHIGEEHTYYDGPHCSYGFGYLQFGWAPTSCAKCEEEA